MIWVLLACQTETSVIKQNKQLTVSPSLLDLGSIAVGATAEDAVVLTHADGTAIDIVDINILNIEGSWFSTDTTTFSVDVGESHELLISYAPQDAGYHRARLTITTDEEENPTHNVELRGAAIAPMAAIFPPVLDFGPITVATTQNITLSNLGSVELSLAGFTFSNPVFSSTQAAATLAPGDSLDIPITATPTSPDPETGTVRLDLGAATVPDVILRANDCDAGDPEIYDTDGDGFTVCGGDCDDSDGSRAPNLAESCDGVDNNCDGTPDEQTECYDDDGDGTSEDQGDCNDSDAGISGQQREIPGNGIDDDCDGVTDSGGQDADLDGYSAESGDCDDGDGAIHPGAVEAADGVDNDCDGVIDEGTTLFDDDGDGFAEVAGDCDDGDASVHPGAAEQGNRVDDDCDGTVDEGTSLFDDDGDGFSEVGGDCEDGNVLVSPAMLEVVGDGLDNDCDGVSE